MRSLRKTARGLQIKGLAEAFRNFNDDSAATTSAAASTVPSNPQVSKQRRASAWYANDSQMAGPKAPMKSASVSRKRSMTCANGTVKAVPKIIRVEGAVAPSGESGQLQRQFPDHQPIGNDSLGENSPILDSLDSKVDISLNIAIVCCLENGARSECRNGVVFAE